MEEAPTGAVGFLMEWLSGIFLKHNLDVNLMPQHFVILLKKALSYNENSKNYLQVDQRELFAWILQDPQVWHDAYTACISLQAAMVCKSSAALMETTGRVIDIFCSGNRDIRPTHLTAILGLKYLYKGCDFVPDSLINEIAEQWKLCGGHLPSGLEESKKKRRRIGPISRIGKNMISNKVSTFMNKQKDLGTKYIKIGKIMERRLCYKTN